MVDKISARERGYASSLEAQLAAVTKAALSAHREALHDYLEFIETIEASDEPNLRLGYSFRMGKKRLKLEMEVPKIFVLMLKEFDVQKSIVDTSFYIQSTEKSQVSTDSTITTGVTASGGIGFLGKVKASFSAKAGVKSDRQRSTDQRSECKVHMEIGPGEVPEGIARIRDSYLEAFDTMMKAISTTVQEQFSTMVEEQGLIEVEDVKELPPVEDAEE